MTIPPDWDIEIRALREAANRAGIVGVIDPLDVGIELESADDLLARLKADTTVSHHDELATRRSRRRRVILLASSVAAIGVLITGVLQPWSSTPVQAATPALLDYEFASADAIAVAPGKEPDDVLRRLADAASAMPAAPNAIGTQHVVTDSWYADANTTSADKSALLPQITESWLAPDGSLRILERRDDPLPADGRGLPDDGSWDDRPKTADETQPPGSTDPNLVADLPTNPDALRKKLLKITGCPQTKLGTTRSLCLYTQIVDMYQTNVVPPQIDAAVWKMLPGEQGFRSLGKVKDRAGRTGVGISLIAEKRPNYRLMLIADPKTGDILGTEQILTSAIDGLEVRPPAIMGFTAILESEYVD
jgi:hypothetical protein